VKGSSQAPEICLSRPTSNTSAASLAEQLDPELVDEFKKKKFERLIYNLRRRLCKRSQYCEHNPPI
jgi:hypothetical protein